MAADTISAPVEIAIIEFPGSRFNGEIVPALTQLVDDGIVSIIDLVLVSKDVDGSVIVLELSELDDELAGAFDDLDGEPRQLGAADRLAGHVGGKARRGHRRVRWAPRRPRPPGCRDGGRGPRRDRHRVTWKERDPR